MLASLRISGLTSADCDQRAGWVECRSGGARWPWRYGGRGRSRDGGGGGGGGSGGGRGGGHGHGQSRPFMGVVRVVGCILIRTPVLYCRPTLAFYRYPKGTS